MHTLSHRPSLALALMAALTLAGCATSQSGDVYSRDQAQQEMTVRMGVVESVRQVTIAGTRSGVGTVAGAAIGGVAGSNVGEGKGSTVAAILGAVAGGLAGSALENKTTGKAGVEITVRLDNGQYTAIVQEATGETFAPGEKVRILSGNGTSRVTH